MIVQFKVIFFMFIMNVVSCTIVAWRTGNGQFVIAGTQYTGGLNATAANATSYEQEFNATQAAKDWTQKPFLGIPVIGDIFSGMDIFITTIRGLIDGFPQTLDWCASFIPVEGGQAAFAVIGGILRIVFAFCAITLIVEFISGRVLLP